MTLRKRLLSPVPLVLDGALGTLLPEVSQSHPLWSTHTLLTSPEIIRSIHKSYIKSGAQLIQTSTYQTSKEGLKNSEFDVEYKEALNRSIDLAYEAKSGEEDIWIVGSVGPFGASLANGAEYTGDYGHITHEELKKFHKERIEVLCFDKRVDIVGLETIPNILEVKVLIDLMEKYKKDYYLSLSVSGDTLADGSTLDELRKVVSGANGLIAIGINCLSLENSLKWLRSLKSIGIDLIVYPNSGEIYDGIKKNWIPNPRGTMSWRDYLEEIKKIGNVKIIGGCCRTTPDTIKEISTLVKELWNFA